MNFLAKLFGKKPESSTAANEEAVLVYLDGLNLPKETYEEYDLSTLEVQLISDIESRGLGEFDGNEFGSNETILYMYGPDADVLFSGIEATLRAYPLCKNARVLIRKGGPGCATREVRLV